MPLDMELEAVLRPTQYPMVAYPPKFITLANGKKMVIRQAAEADKLFREMYGESLEERFTPDKYQLMHIEMFPHHIIHAECVGGDIDLLRSTALFAVCNQRTTIGFFPWRFVDGESCIGRCVAMIEDAEYGALMQAKAALPQTRYGDAFDPTHVERLNAQVVARR